MPRTLLLADDSVTIQRVIELTFADEDINVVAVSDGDQAIERLESTTPDIVLADIGMPGRNGYEVARYIRQTPRLAHIPVMLLTGAFEPVDQERAAEVGCDGVLAKPFEPQLVIGRVKDLLARPRTGAAHDPHAAQDPKASAAASAAVGQWDLVTTERPPVAQTVTLGGGELNDYFDRLDAAFANLGTTTAPTPSSAEPAPSGAGGWYGSDQSAGSAHRPVLEQWDFDSLDPTPPSVAAPQQPPVETASTTSLPPKPAVLPSLADAFMALLAAEQHTLTPDLPGGWPATAPVAAPSSSAAEVAAVPVAFSEETIEEVTRRVLDRLSDQVVRQTVADIVSQVAERLVTEEIERIKRTIE